MEWENLDIFIQLAKIHTILEVFCHFARPGERFVLCRTFWECYLCSTVLKQGLSSSSGSSWAWEAASWHICPGGKSREREWRRRPINTAWLQLCCSVNQVHSAKMSQHFTAQHWVGWKSPTALFVWGGLESSWRFRDVFDQENGLCDCAVRLSSLPYQSPSTFQWLWNLL